MGSANLIAEATSDEEMFPVSMREILNWKRDNPNQSEWMSDDNIAYIIRRGRQYDLEQSTMNKIRRNERKRENRRLKHIKELEKEISYRAIGAEKPQRSGTRLHKYEIVARRFAQASRELQDLDRFDRGDEDKLIRKRDYSAKIQSIGTSIASLKIIRNDLLQQVKKNQE